METLLTNHPGQVKDLCRVKFSKRKLALLLALALLLFLLSGVLIQEVFPQAGVLDYGILSLLTFGLLLAVVALCSSIWLLHLLWRPFKNFNTQFDHYFNQLLPWQQCKLYFSVFFLLVFTFLSALAIIL